MKICLINNVYPPFHRGGAEQVLVKTVEGLQHAGHEVVLITSSPSSAQGYSYEKGVHVYRLTPPNIFFYTDLHAHSILLRMLWHVIDMFNVFVTAQVEQIICKEQPDVIHTHNLMGLSFTIPRLIKRLGIRHVHTVHDVQLVEPSAMIIKAKEHEFRYHNPGTYVYRQIMRLLMESPDVVISPSQFLQDFYTSRGFFPHSNIHIIRNPLTFVGEQAAILSSSKQQSTFLYLGQIEHHKGIQTLIDAFAAFRDQDVILHIVGDGSLLPSVVAQTAAQKNIIIHGRKSHDALPELLKTIDMTIVPSLCYENSPTVIFESFAFHIPVIASDIDGIAELIVEGNNGITFHAGNSLDLQQKIAWCLSHKDKMREMKTHTATSLEGLSCDSYIKNLEQFYQGK